MNRRRLLRKLASGALRNVAFSDFRSLVEGFGFRLDRVAGSHHIFVHPNIPELVNLQEVRGEAKPYQMASFLSWPKRHNLRLAEDS
jgi:predicted RNA binding protein YcfA (HicA-like mRNA interferase family)